jgi:tetratricopeptide (TPR) repeat protein
MYCSSLFLTAALVGTTVALVQPVAVAKSASEIESIARAITVEIKLKQNGSVGSGVIIDKKGDLYTLVTNRHVVCGKSNCQNTPEGEVYSLGLVDGQKYRVKKSAIKLLGSDVDLAIIQFRSNRNYVVAKVAASESLKAEDDVYTAGFPFEQPSFTFGEGKAIAVVSKRLTGDNGGYTIVYDAFTLPGMSGGGVFDRNGQLVAIHGQGERFQENTVIDNKPQVGNKLGYNQGIPVLWLVKYLTEVGINLGTSSSVSGIRTTRAQVPTTADEYFIAGFNKFVERSDNAGAGKQLAIQNFSNAIRLNPRYQYAYFMRAYVYWQIKEFQKSLADYNQSISLNPKNSLAYYNRALLKEEKLNDIQGALADYNQSIYHNPRNAYAYAGRAGVKYFKLNDTQGALADLNQSIYLNPSFHTYVVRALLKYEKLNDIKGALADLNQSISLNPKYPEAYSLRAILRNNKLNDRPGAIQDLRQAARLYREQGKTEDLRSVVQFLRELGATE